MTDSEPTKKVCPIGIDAIEFGERMGDIKSIASDVRGLLQGQQLQNGRMLEHDKYIAKHKEYHAGRVRLFKNVKIVVGILGGLCAILFGLLKL